MAQLPTVRAPAELLKRVRAFIDELPDVDGRSPTYADAIRTLLERGLGGGKLTRAEAAGYVNGYARALHEMRLKAAGVEK